MSPSGSTCLVFFCFGGDYCTTTVPCFCHTLIVYIVHFTSFCFQKSLHQLKRFFFTNVNKENCVISFTFCAGVNTCLSSPKYNHTDWGTRRGWVVSSTSRPYFTPGRDPVPVLQEAGWAPGPVWTGGKSCSHRDSIPDRPARSSVAIPTELPGPHISYYSDEIKYGPSI